MKQEQENYSENEAYWNKRSEIFDTQILTTYEEAYRKTIDYTKKYLKDSDKALDIGCGTGVTTIELAGSVAEMTAVDTAPEMLRQAREKAKKAEAGNIDFIQGDMFMEELKPGTYDAVMIFNVLLYMPDQAAAMKRLQELVKPGGYIFVAADCLKHSCTKEALRKWYRSRTGKMPFVEFYTPESLEQMIENGGFEIMEREALFERPVNYFLAARKKVTVQPSAKP